MNDPDWMQMALALAQRGRGFVEPNPMVGAVVVRDGSVVGTGWHQKFGEAHAEIHALAEAGEASRGATLYVTLEPCCHWGKTPPCTEAVIRAGIARVVAAMADPFPKVAGGGIQQLREAGIAIEVGMLEAEARKINAPYVTLLSKLRPYVHAKWAMTLDGKIATRTGHSRWISSEDARRRVHDLRGRVDAIIVGAGTVRADDPQLTARPPGPRTALRVVLSRRGELPPNCRLLRTARDVPVLIAGSEIGEVQRQILESHGCEVLTMGLPELLAELGRRRMTNLLVEGGAALFGSFRDANLIDEVHVFIAPILVGGVAGFSPIAGTGVATVSEGLQMGVWTCERIGNDWYVNGTIADDSSTGTR